MAQIEDALVVRMEASLRNFEKQMARGQKVANDTATGIERRFDNTNKRLGKSSESAAKGLGRVFETSRQGRFVLQNTAAQLSDVAVQLEMGTSASRVMSQQLPQILGGFASLGGTLGIVAPLLGTVAAVGIPLAAMFLTLGGDAEEAAEKVQTFEEKLDAARKAIGLAEAAAVAASAGGLDDLRDKYGEVTSAVTELADALSEIERRAASLEVRQAVGGIFQGDFRKQIDDLFGYVGAAFVEGNSQQAEALRREIETLEAEIANSALGPNPGQLNILTQMREEYAVLTQNIAEAGSLASEIKVDPATLQSIRDLEVAAKQALADDNFAGFSDILRELRGQLEAAGLEASNGLVVALVNAEDVAREAANRLGEAEVNAGGVASAAGGIVGPVGAAADEAARLSGNLVSAMSALASVTAGMAAAQRRAAAQARIARDYAGDPIGRAGAEARSELTEASGAAAYELIRSGGASRLGGVAETNDRLVAGAENVARIEQEAEAAEAAAKAAAREAAKAAAGGSGGRASGKSGGKSGKTDTPLFENIEADIQSMQRRIEMIGKTRGEVAELEARYRLLDEAKKRGLDLDQRQAETGETLAQQIDRQAAAVGNLTAKYEQAEQRAQFFEDVQSQLKDGLLDAIVAGEDFAGVLGNIAKMLAKAALEAALFGSGPMAGGGGGGLLSGLMGGIFGGARAAGGPVMGGKTYLVGEKGPELFTAPHGGKIVPNHAMGGGGGGSMNLSVNVTGARGNSEIREMVMQGVQQGIGAYDRQMPGRVQQIQRDPRAR